MVVPAVDASKRSLFALWNCSSAICMIQVTSRGGALYTERSSLTISACNFTNNAAAFGGAIYASHAQVSDASFLGNKSNGGTGRGHTDGDPPGNGSDGGKGGAVSLINTELPLRLCRRDIAYMQAVRFPTQHLQFGK